jgi:DNA-binding transcriptional LysR family regulator
VSGQTVVAVDWDKVRIFYAAAEAGSFTKAGSSLNLSQSAISRHVSALEDELRVPLFHRHARGLILTEQGELLYRTARDVLQKLEQTRAKLTDSKEKPNGELKITANIGLGTHWLTPRLSEFVDQFPDITVQLLLTDDELDLAMREADVALRLRQPQQSDLIQRKLFTVHFHAYASADYLKRFGQLKSLEDLDNHRLLKFGGTLPPHLLDLNWHITAGKTGREARDAAFVVNNLAALIRACQRGIGVAILPDYLLEQDSGLVRLLTSEAMPELDCFLVYPEEMRGVARVQAFRDFVVGKAQRWNF